MSISDARKPKTTPEKLIDDFGTPNFGVFTEPFRDFNLRNFKKDSKLRRCFNYFRLTEWEAVEVISNKAAFLTVVYKFGIMNIHKTIFYNLETKELKVWDDLDLFRNTSVVAKNLLDGNQSIYQKKKGKTIIVNNYEANKARCFGYSKHKKHEIEFDFELSNISKPSIVSIPVKEKYPIYTEKDLFKFNGFIRVDGVDYFDNESSLAIIDDHRGYYPRKSGFDWLTVFGYFNDNIIGINLTDFFKNHLQEDFNENGYWDEQGFNLLPNAKFHCDETTKTIKDEEGRISLNYRILKTHKVSMNMFIFKIDYQLNFGELNGYIIDNNGEKIIFENALSLAEYRYTVL